MRRGGIQEKELYRNATGLNRCRHRRKEGHRQHLLQLAWRLQDRLTDPFGLQAAALV